jgi:thiol-disulfide isomerase/thioredoxin
VDLAGAAAVKRIAIALIALSCNNTTRPTGAADVTPDPAASARPSPTTTTASASADPPATPDAAPPPPAHDPKTVRLVAAAQDTDALSQIRTMRLEAKKDGRVLVVYVSASWCEPCRKFKDEIHSGRLDERLAKTTLLAFDADRDGDRLGGLGYSFKFIPFIALPGPDGRPTDSQEARGKGGQAWKELLGKLDDWQAKGPK